jgi:excisionase family DNA binding protein
VTASPWLDVDSAATYAAVSITTIRRAIKSGGLKAYRVQGGRLLRLRALDVDAWIEGAAPRVSRLDGSR